MCYKPFLIIIIVIFLFSYPCFAAPDVHFGPTPTWVVPVKDNDRQPNLRDVNDGYYLKLYEQEVNVEKQEVYQHTIKDIVSDAGIQGASNLSINFNPAYEQLTVHQITVWRNGVALNKLQKDAFKVIANEQELSRYIYNGNYTAYLILKDIRSGDKIEYSYTVKGSNPIFNNKFFYSYTFQGTDPISQIHYCVLSPASRTFNVKYFNNAAKPVVTKTNNTVLYDWDLLDLKGLQDCHNTPSWFNHFPYAQISEFNSWGEVIDWAYKINMPEDKLEGVLSKRVQQLKQKYGADHDALFRAIVEIVQNEVRYMGVEIGDYSHRANKPEKVYEQRYGDCKDKSLLLVSILRNAGFGADMALVNTSYKAKIEDDLPSPSSFNHAIVIVHFPGKNVWIDPTISYQGGTGIDFYFPDYGNALVLVPGTNSLTDIPEVPSGDIKYTEDYEVGAEQDPVSLTVTTTYSASNADDMRMTVANQSKSDLEKNYLDYYLKTYPHIESSDTLIINDDKNTNAIETIERYNINDFFEFDSANQNYSASFYASMIKNELPIVGEIKEYPIAVTYPYSIHYTININARINWQIKHKSEKILRNAYSFSYDVSAHNDRLSIQYTFTYLKDHIAPEEIAQYEKDRKKMVDDYLSYSFTDTPPRPNTHSGLNYLAILVMISLWCGCAYAGVRIYKMKTTRNQFAYHDARVIGGWIILPVIGLIFSACKSLYSLFENGFLLNRIWHVYDGLSEAFQFKMLMWLELTFNVIIFCFTIFCLLLMYKKRDILPLYIKVLYIVSMIVVIADNFFAHAVFPTSAIEYNNIIRGVLAVCIWVPYFSMSLRVKETFIVPYPDNRNEMQVAAQSTSQNNIIEPMDGNIEEAE